MNKKEQQKYISLIEDTLKENDLTIKWLLNKVNVSRSHWYFLRKAHRPLTDETKKNIDSNMSLMINTD